MKKYLSVILEIILTACLVACGSSNKDSVNDDNRKDVVHRTKLYPESSIEVRFFCRGHGILYWYCNHHGLFQKRI